MARPNNPPLPIPLTAAQQASILDLINKSFHAWSVHANTRHRMERIDMAYYREGDKSPEHLKAKKAMEYGDTSRFQNITVPVVKPQVESAVVYQSSVFLQGYPMFGTVASPEFVDAGLAMDAKIEQDQIKCGWTQEFIMFFRDLFKYETGAIEVTWDRQKMRIPTYKIKDGVVSAAPEEIIWQGNRIKRLVPYNTYCDPTVERTKVYSDGAFAGYYEYMTSARLKKFLGNLPVTMNVREAMEAGLPGGSMDYENSKIYFPEINSNLFVNLAGVGGAGADMNWMTFLTGSNDESKRRRTQNNIFEVGVHYQRMIPNLYDIRLNNSGTIQVFKIITVNGVMVYFDLESNVHGNIPILFGSPNCDGLMNQAKSVADDALPFQSITTALANSIIASRRKAISDKTVYDPSRIETKHINSESPVANIPLKPIAYGTNPSDAVYPFPFRDDQASEIVRQIGLFNNLANVVSGQNPARQGQFVKGNKTQGEFDTVMQGANGRDQLVSILLEAQVMTPCKEIIKANILQYQGAASLFSQANQQTYQYDPARMHQAVLEFKLSDGLIPTDKMMDADSFATAVQVLGSSPQLAAGYNIAPVFSYLMKQRGADLRFAEKSPEQVAYEQAMGAWQQAVVEVAKSGATAFPPQPTPEAYGYRPATAQNGNVVQQPARVNNITNNITNAGD